MSQGPPTTDPFEPPAPEPALEGQELRRLATSGAVLVAFRGAAIRLIGLGGYLVLARLLTPADFGIAALGLSITFFGQFLADAGLGPALLRGKETPSRTQFASVVGWQLAVVTAVVAIVGATGAVTESKPVVVATIFLAGLPFLAARLPAAITLERRLEYKPLVTAEVVEVLAFNVVAITVVALGAGVYGLAAASVLKTFVGWFVLVRLAPGHSVWPRLRLGPLKGLLKFGLLFQASSAVTISREAIWSVGVSAIAGYEVLGLWAIVARLIGVPLLVFESLWRVSFPAMARLLESGEDPRGAIERGLSVAAILTGVLLAPLAAGGSDALTGVLGAQWSEAGSILPLVCLGMFSGLPVSVVATGYLYARGQARTVLMINLALSGTLLATGFALLPLIGYVAMGVAWMLGSAVDGLLLGRALRSQMELSTIKPLLKPFVASLVAYGAGSAAAAAPVPVLAAGIAGGAVAVAAYVACLWLIDRAGVEAAWRTIARALRHKRS